MAPILAGGSSSPIDSSAEVKTVREFPRAVREIENVWIPLPDGCRLAARVWLPQDAEHDPVPAILEYLPYRKRDFTATRDELTHSYFAGHGYACIRVDMRGSGDSDGLLWGEYLKQEQDDALEVVDWIVRQTWSTGAVGIIGISWGGFNGLQIAARRPAALKAVITVCSTDNRYADDVHYIGGSAPSEQSHLGTTMLAYMTRPPDPALVGARSAQIGRAIEQPALPRGGVARASTPRRLLETRFRVREFLGHHVRGVRGRRLDGRHPNSIPRLLAGLEGPRKGLIGPWGHRLLRISQRRVLRSAFCRRLSDGGTSGSRVSRPASRMSP